MNKNIPETQTKFAFESHLAQYESIRDEVRSATELQNNLMSYSIAAIAGIIALFAIKDSHEELILLQQPFLLPIISALMSMLTWASLEAEMRIHDWGVYIENVLSQKVQNLIGGPGLPDDYIVFKNPVAEISRAHTIRSISRGILVSGKFMVSYIPAVVILIFYATLIDNWQSSILFWIAAVPALFVPVILFVQVFFVAGYYWKLSKKPFQRSINRKTKPKAR